MQPRHKWLQPLWVLFLTGLQNHTQQKETFLRLPKNEHGSKHWYLIFVAFEQHVVSVFSVNGLMDHLNFERSIQPASCSSVQSWLGPRNYPVLVVARRFGAAIDFTGSMFLVLVSHFLWHGCIVCQKKQNCANWITQSSCCNIFFQCFYCAFSLAPLCKKECLVLT